MTYMPDDAEIRSWCAVHDAGSVPVDAYRRLAARLAALTAECERHRMTTSQSPTHPDAPRAGGETPILYCATCGYHPVVPAGQLGEICAWCQRDGYRIKLVSSFIASAVPSPERASK